ncbi:flagellar motor protein MotB [Ferruginibacter sp.]|uniref:OmpA/MotB family protein n=1 Tax=Ferruginibacter sp. TaxID=1940288 RepID=UPI002659F528|nr:flagellar motor protein MotB [Ferruginibacter sp.]
MKKYLPVLLAIVFLPGCVAKKLLVQSQMQTAVLRTDSTKLANRVLGLNGDITGLQKKIADLDKRIADITVQNNLLTDQINLLNSKNNQLGQLTEAQKDKLSQTEQTLAQQKENLLTQQQKLQQLQSLLTQQQNQSLLLKNRMAEALKGFSSNDLSVVQKNGKVYVSLSENLLFPSGSAVVNRNGVDALSKLAAVLNTELDVSVNIEGHTDSIPIRGKYKDNWDLSTARANAIVRILVNNYKVDPVRVIASGHSYFDPLQSNSTPEGRAKNRRTEIILSPKLDEMYKLLGM